jgi:ABC-2 type transport system ATP-binding protein
VVDDDASPGSAGRGAAVEVRDLVVRYGALVAVDGVSFTARSGEVTALLGPNGAGKTTTVEAIEGYRRTDAGTVRVLGLDPRRDHAAVIPRLGVMLQEGGVYTGIRPAEVLGLFASYYDDPTDPEELLARVGLDDRRHTAWRHLSGGERQRLSLALALVGRPEVVVLDEPTSGIDPTGRLVVRDVIADLRRSGVSVLVTTHDLAEAERLADHVVILDHGRVVADATPAELTDTTGADHFRFGAPGGIDVVALGAHLSVVVVEERAGEYRVDASPSPAIVAALTAWLAGRDLPLADLRAGRQSLEDVFLRLTAERGGESGDGPATDDRSGRGGRIGRGGRRRGRTTPGRSA